MENATVTSSFCLQCNISLSGTLFANIGYVHVMCAAVSLYEKALALRPQQPEALYNMACACFESGHCERASFFYETMLSHAPRSAEAWNNLGTPFDRPVQIDLHRHLLAFEPSGEECTSCEASPCRALPGAAGACMPVKMVAD